MFVEFCNTVYKTVVSRGCQVSKEKRDLQDCLDLQVTKDSKATPEPTVRKDRKAEEVLRVLLEPGAPKEKGAMQVLQVPLVETDYPDHAVYQDHRAQ